MNKKSILFITIDYPPMPGGMSRLAHVTARALNAKGLLACVVAPESGIQAEAFDGIAVERIPGARPGELFIHYWKTVARFFRCAWRSCRRLRISMIIANTWSIAGVTAFLINKTLGIPYAVFVNGLDVYAPQNKKRAAFMMKAVLRNARRIIAISGYTEKIIRRVMPDAAVTVIHPAIDVDAYVMKPANAARKEEGKIILTVARLVLHKGHETVIRGLPLVLARFPSLKYVIVGDGPCRASLEALAKETGVADHVRFTGYVLNTELAAYYNDCDVFVLASEEKDDDREGFGIVLLEAAASGRPVVASNSGGIPEAVAQGVTALLVEPRDERALADAVIRLLSDPEYARQLGDNGRRRVESEFSLGVLTTRLEELITS